MKTVQNLFNILYGSAAELNSFNYTIALLLLIASTSSFVFFLSLVLFLIKNASYKVIYTYLNDLFIFSIILVVIIGSVDLPANKIDSFHTICMKGW